jgi:putative membrane protein
MKFLIDWLVATLVVIAIAFILPGVSLDGMLVAFIVALVLGLSNAVVKPIFIILTLPITLITLGLFIFVVNALMVLLTAWIVDGFYVDNFWWALLFGVILSMVNMLRNTRND